MPSQFGAPAKVAITENNNKINVQILSYDTTGKLTSIVSNTLKQNLANYLSNYRMMNDYISIETAEVIDLSLDISVVLDATQNQGQVITNIINKVSTFLDPQIRNLGQNIYISQLNSLIQDENGVITVTAIDVFNEVGGQYSGFQTSMAYSNDVTRQIRPVDDTIFAQPNQVYQIRYPNKDIRVKVKNFQNVQFS
jgi:hypothetical protein